MQSGLFPQVLAKRSQGQEPPEFETIERAQNEKTDIRLHLLTRAEADLSCRQRLMVLHAGTT